jgi:hypothetical protein
MRADHQLIELAASHHALTVRAIKLDFLRYSSIVHIYSLFGV